MKPQRIFLFLVLMAVIIGIIWAFSMRAPRCHGRTLTSWLRQYGDTPLNETQRLQEAQNAIRSIGPSDALPKLLNLVAATDDPVSLWLIAKTDKYRTRFLRWQSAEHYSYAEWQRTQWHAAGDFQQLGIAGFEVLATNAGPAVEELKKLPQQPAHTFTAQAGLADRQCAFSACLPNLARNLRANRSRLNAAAPFQNYETKPSVNVFPNPA